MDEAVEEKDGGEKVRLGMVVCFVPLLSLYRLLILITLKGHPWQLGGDARGTGTNRRRRATRQIIVTHARRRHVERETPWEIIVMLILAFEVEK
jgi:hypothetical protein